MKVIFLGTNGWYDTKTGNTTCTLIETKKYYVIFDAGNGFYKIGHFIKSQKPIYLFISHFHLDHIIGLHTLSKFNFKQGLRIYGQNGTKRILNQIINKPFTAAFKELPFRVTVHDFSEGVHYIPFYVKCKMLKHVSKCLGYRLKLENKVISYCTDTEACESIVELAKNADLFITECSYAFGQSKKNWPHLNPETSATIAKKARAKNLALLHFDAEIYPSLSHRKKAEKIAKQIFKNSIVTKDNLKITI